MADVHVHETTDPVVVDSSGDRTAAAGINLITVLIVLAVLAVLAWFLFAGPLHTVVSTPGNSTTINNNPPAQSQNQPNVNINPNVNVNPPASNSGSSSTGSSSTGSGSGH